jgi:hypothetical protein
MKNLLFNIKAVQKGTHKAEVGAKAGTGPTTFWKSELKLEPKQMVLALQHCPNVWICMQLPLLQNLQPTVQNYRCEITVRIDEQNWEIKKVQTQ